MDNLKLLKTILFLLGILVFPAKTLRGSAVAPATQGETGEVAIHFPVNQSRLLKDFSGNARSLMTLDRMLNDIDFYSDIDSIIIDGYASPEGSILLNSRLSYERALTVKEYIAQNYPHIGSNKIVANGRLVDMQAISNIINNDMSVPYQQWAKEAMATQGVSDMERLAHLKGIGNGAVIQHITQYYAASLRNATGIMFYRASDRVITITEEIVIIDTVLIKGDERVDTVFVNNPADTVFIEKSADTVFVNTDNGNERIKKPLFALKTNLLYDLASAVNVELEIPIGDHWSLLGEYVFPWWLIEDKQYALQVINANLETRYWFGNRDDRPKLTGWFAGLYAGGGYYDIEWGSKGYQGEFYVSTGLTAGFAHRLGKSNSLRMEYSLGAGYFKTQYSEYNPVFGNDDQWHLMHRLSGNYSWIGPTRLKMSLVWLLHYSSYNK